MCQWYFNIPVEYAKGSGQGEFIESKSYATTAMQYLMAAWELGITKQRAGAARDKQQA
jgi:hypothetical protein